MADENEPTEAETEEQTAETEQVDDPDGAADDEQTYPAKIVKDLRKENASYRERAHAAEARVNEISRQLFRLRVEATGKLADPDDLPYNPDLLGNDGKLNAAVDELISKRPHYAKRKPQGSVGQGERGQETVPHDFSALLRG